MKNQIKSRPQCVINVVQNTLKYIRNMKTAY